MQGCKFYKKRKGPIKKTFRGVVYNYNEIFSIASVPTCAPYYAISML